MSYENRTYCEECDRYFASPRGLSSHNGRAHPKAKKPKPTECGMCGALVVNEATHLRWHGELAAVAQQTQTAHLFTTPIGPSPGTPLFPPAAEPDTPGLLGDLLASFTDRERS